MYSKPLELLKDAIVNGICQKRVLLKTTTVGESWQNFTARVTRIVNGGGPLPE